MQIRHAVPSDLLMIDSVYNQAVSAGQKTGDLTPYTPETRLSWFLNHANLRYPLWVAEDMGVIKGFVSLSPYRPGREALRFTAEVSFYVDEQFHRQGIASQLLQQAITQASQIGLKTLFAIVMDSNQASVQLLLKFDFAQWGHMPGVADFGGVEIGHLYFGKRIIN